VPAQGRLSSPYGMRNGRLHAGIDIANSTGTPIYAARAGTVSRSARSDSYGEVIYIDHGGAETRYAHLSKRRVLTGARVAKGERIGDMGSTGRSTGPHLHFEVRRSGSPINPITVLPKR
jgi:murein DD-endopeptidase MepM/ murein hydrolase activator NlpD